MLLLPQDNNRREAFVIISTPGSELFSNSWVERAWKASANKVTIVNATDKVIYLTWGIDAVDSSG